jgi:hypothetical protein
VARILEVEPLLVKVSNYLIKVLSCTMDLIGIDLFFFFSFFFFIFYFNIDSCWNVFAQFTPAKLVYQVSCLIQVLPITGLQFLGLGG